jgi:hypothetical protein
MNRPRQLLHTANSLFSFAFSLTSGEVDRVNAADRSHGIVIVEAAPFASIETAQVGIRTLYPY